MTQVFQRHGIRFEFPDDWIVHEESDPTETTITVNSPETSFWTLTLLHDRPDPQHVLDSAIETFRELYQEVDAYPGHDHLNEREALAIDLDFVCHDLISSVFLRTVVTSQFTVFVLYQGADLELDETQAILEQITKSLSWDDFDEPEDVDVARYLTEEFLEPDTSA